MSEITTPGETVVTPETLDTKSTAPETKETKAPEAVSKLLKVHGKEFDVSTDLGLMQAQAWAEAISSVVGRQGQELGDLRKRQFTSETSREDDSIVAKKAKEKASQGDIEGAIDEVLAFARDTEQKANLKIEIERKNASLWDEYFADRPALSKKLGREKVKKIAEASIDLYPKDGDVFQSLDEFFLPLVGSFEEKPNIDAKASSKSSEKPPASLSGRAPVSTPAAQESSKKMPSMDEILSARTLSRKS